MITERINIDVRPGGVPVVIHVTQYEAGLRQFIFTPYTSGGTLTAVAGSATLEGTKPDGYAFQQACEMVDGVITYTLQEQLCAVEGRVWSRLVIRDTDGGMIGYTAIVWVVGCAGVKDDAVMSDSDISALQQFLDEFGTIDAYRGALNGALAAVGGPLVAATASAMTDRTKVYVYTGSETGYTEGHWYYWNGSAWTDGGVYQSAGINTDKTLTVADMAADAKATGDALASYGLSGNVIDEYYSGDSLINNGITFTRNADGTVSSSGTATGQARYYWLYKHDIPAGNYVLTGLPPDAGYQSFYLQYAIADAGATPAASDYVVVMSPTAITVPANKNLSIRTWYKAGYVDDGRVWETRLLNADNENALDGKYNPYNFVPIIYTADANADTALTDVENIKSMIYTDIDLTWKQYNQTGSSTYDYIKCTPLDVEKSAKLSALIPDTYTQYNVVKYASLSDAIAGYDASVGTGNQLSATGWLNGAEYTIQPGYYIILLRHTNRNAIVGDGDIISIIKSNLLDVSDIVAVNSNLPLFYDKEAELADAVQTDRDSNTITFVLSADNHYNDYDRLDKMQTDYAVQMSRISNNIGVDFIGTLGDIIEGFDDYLPTADYYDNYHNINERRLTDMALAYSSDDLPFIYVAGHHEMYPINDDTAAEIFAQNRGFYTNDLKVIMYGQRRPGVQGTRNYNVGYRKFNAVNISGISGGADYDQKSGVSASYYFDITKNSSKIRIIVIDSCAYTAFGYSPETVTFINDALTDAQTNSIPCIILSHIPFRWQQYRNGAGAVPANEASFDDVIIAHKSIIKAYFHGHTHCDNIVTNETLNSENVAPYADITFPLISLACQKTAQVQQAAGYFIGDFHAYGYRNPAEYTGYCFTVINYHLDTGVIKMFRYGAGDTGTYPTWTV